MGVLSPRHPMSGGPPTKPRYPIEVAALTRSAAQEGLVGPGARTDPAVTSWGGGAI